MYWQVVPPCSNNVFFKKTRAQPFRGYSVPYSQSTYSSLVPFLIFISCSSSFFLITNIPEKLQLMICGDVFLLIKTTFCICSSSSLFTIKQPSRTLSLPPFMWQSTREKREYFGQDIFQTVRQKPLLHRRYKLWEVRINLFWNIL